MLECHHAVVLSTILASETGIRLPGCLFLVVCYRRGACRSGRSGNRRRPCRVLCRRRSSAWAASFFCRLLFLHCSRIRALIAHRSSLFHCERSPRRPPSCWLVLTVLRVFELSFVRAVP